MEAITLATKVLDIYLNIGAGSTISVDFAFPHDTYKHLTTQTAHCLLVLRHKRRYNMKLTIFAAALLLMTSVVMIQARSMTSQVGGIQQYLKVR